MTSIDAIGFQSAELKVTAAVDDGALRLTLSGSADSRVMAEMMALLAGAHEEMLRRKGTLAIVDFRPLEFMNSSCFKAFVTWISRVQELEPGQQYRIHFVSDPGKHWQHRSLAALSCFATDLIRIET
jgi:hypothetical protein